MFDKKSKAYHAFAKKVNRQLEDVKERINYDTKINRTPMAAPGATQFPHRSVLIGMCTIAGASRFYSR